MYSDPNYCDYNLGRFLSVDPFIQFTGNSQSINPYSYIMNNPLAGTDPSGYLVAESFDCDKFNCGALLSGMGAISLETNNGGEKVQTVTGSREYVNAEAESLLAQGYKRELGRANVDGTVTETFVKPTSGGTPSPRERGISLDDIAKDPAKWIESLTLYTRKNGGFSSNNDIDKAIAEESEKDSVDSEISSTEEQREFVVEAHKVIGRHLKQFNKGRRGRHREVELTMEIRQSASGEMIVSNAFLAELGARVTMTRGTDFVVHWHHQSNDRQGGKGDYLIARNIGLSNFAVVMNRRGTKYSSIYEIGKPNGVIQQRKVNLRTGSTGAWHNSPEWHEVWNQ